jgi:hypothetical protein
MPILENRQCLSDIASTSDTLEIWRRKAAKNLAVSVKMSSFFFGMWSNVDAEKLRLGRTGYTRHSAQRIRVR